MSITAALLALGSSVFWAIFDLTRKKLTEEVPTVVLTFLLVAGQIPFFIFWAFSTDSFTVEQDYWTFGAACAVVNLYSNVAFIQSVKIADLSRTIPVLTLTPVIASIIAYFSMDEVLNTNQILGIIFIFVGCFAIQGSSLKALFNWGQNEDDKSQIVGMLLMVTVAAGWAMTSSLDKLSMNHSSAAAHACIQCAIISLALFLWIRVFGKGPKILKVSKKTINIYALTLIVAVLALGMQLLAIQQAMVGLVEAMKRSTGIIFAIILGRVFFQEKITTWKVVTGSFIVFGLWLLLI